MRNQIGVCDQNARCVGMRPENTDGLSGLDQKGLTFSESLQRSGDLIEITPGPRGTSNSTVDDEFIRVLCDLPVEIVVEHSEGCFRGPRQAVEVRADRAFDVASVL